VGTALSDTHAKYNPFGNFSIFSCGAKAFFIPTFKISVFLFQQKASEDKRHRWHY